MDLWGDGTVFSDPRVGSIPAAELARYDLRIDPASGRVTTAIPIPEGWSVDIGQASIGTGDASSPGDYFLRSILHRRPDGLIDVYGPDGAYQVTSTEDSGAGLLGVVTNAIVWAGVGAGIGEVFSVAQSGGLASQTQPAAVNPSPATGVPTMADPVNYAADAFDPLAWEPYPIPEVDVLDFPNLYDVAPAGPSYPIPDVTVATPSMPSASSIITTVRDATGAVREIGTAVLSTVQLVRAFNGQLQPSTTGRIANAATGLVSGARPAVGVATMTPDGGAIVNNGDGTYTVIGADGSRVTRRYGGSAGSVYGSTGTGGLDTSKLALYGALGLGALLLLKPTRSR